MTGWTSTMELAGSDPEWKSNFSDILSQKQWSKDISPIVDKLKNGERLDFEDGLKLFSNSLSFEERFSEDGFKFSFI